MKAFSELDKSRAIQKIIETKQIDVNQLPKKEDIDRRFIKMAMTKLARNKIRGFYKASVWSGNMPLKFTFKDWDVTKQPNYTKAKALGNQAYLLAKQLKDNDFNVALAGDRGVGKTSLALAMMDYLMNAGRTVMFVSTAELLRMVNDKYTDNSIRGKLESIGSAMEHVDILILDDFGTEGGMTGSIKPVHKDLQDLMYQVSNARVDFENNKARGATIITTNNSKPQLKKMYESKFIDRVYPKNPDHQLLFDKMEGVRNV
ncbi:MAG: ATP-binding protein [Lentilactobacillus hilgardii]|uniref:ATP-binding protein n=1 Tax=Lactobacillaceae TaxID=33958 RepID=UPI001CC20C16|nr:ATP-binding protein [Lentilactobacillus hilgardii]MBZ2200545.1 DNA replication protein [Lentilactobacillus hilgardii]MBZ2204579.1 DNA replication protein [Lentilactobacillus hilgardii]